MTITKHPYYCWLTKEIYKLTKARDLLVKIDSRIDRSHHTNRIVAFKEARTQFRIMMKKGII